jgi:hypothetical protein
MGKRELILRLEVITDDDTGNYRVGEIDYGVAQCPWLFDRKVRTEAITMLRFLADRMESSQAPFEYLKGSATHG